VNREETAAPAPKGRDGRGQVRQHVKIAALGATVSMKSLMQRVNRKLAEQGERLRKTRSVRDFCNLGEYFTVDVQHNCVVRHHVDPEALARELGALQPWERVEEGLAGPDNE
jgi:hypothetical protein